MTEKCEFLKPKKSEDFEIVFIDPLPPTRNLHYIKIGEHSCSKNDCLFCQMEEERKRLPKKRGRDDR